MIVIALTGGIGSGKTEVTKYLESKGYIVIDTDLIAHQITSVGGKAIPYIREMFGDEYILPDGSMDRVKVRNLVYNDRKKKLLLEKGTTEIIIDDTKDMIETYRKRSVDIVFVAIPLFYENGGNYEGIYDEVWAVTASIDIKIKRIKERDKLDTDTIKKIMKNQMPDSEKVKMADKLIDNSGTIDELHKKIDSLLKDIAD